MRILATGLAILLGAASAAAATRKVPQQYETIQAACDAADEGDTILVSKKSDGSPYQEWVNTSKSLRFVGKNVVWDGHRFAEDGGGYSRCLTVSNEGKVDGVEVRGFRFRNGSYHVYIYGDDAVVRNCTFGNSYNSAVDIEGNGATVRNNTFLGNDEGVRIWGDDAFVYKNAFRGHNNETVEVYGSRAVVRLNRFDRSGDRAIYVSGALTEISGNAILDTYEGIYLSGAEGLITKNRLSRIESGEDTGIYVYGNHNLVSKNVINRVLGYGIYCYGSGGSEDGDNNVVEDNSIRWCAEDGIYVYGTHSTVQRNTVAHCEEDGVYAGGGYDDSVNRVLDNTITDSFGRGIYIYGGGHEVRGNVVRDSDSYGIYCYSAYFSVENVVAENAVQGFYSWGIYNYAYDAPFDVSNNVVQGGDSWAGGIEVYAPYASYGWMRGNQVSDVGGYGVYLYGDSPETPLEMTDNSVANSGTSWDYAVYCYAPNSVCRGNTVENFVGAGFYVGGDGLDVDQNSAVNCTQLGMYIWGNGVAVTDNTGTGSDGEGFINGGSNTIFTGNTFLGNRLDVTNSGSFTTPNLPNSNTFETGGSTTSPQYWD